MEKESWLAHREVLKDANGDPFQWRRRYRTSYTTQQGVSACVCLCFLWLMCSLRGHVYATRERRLHASAGSPPAQRPATCQLCPILPSVKESIS